MEMSANEKVKALLDVVEERRQQAEEAHNRVDEEIKRLTENEINVLGTDALSRLSEIAVKVRESNDAKYAELQALVLLIDQECRPLLKENLSYSVVSSIVFMINRLNEESKISTTFNATLQGYDMGNVATSNYLPSIECKMIQSFWQTTCDAMPEAIEEKKRIKEETKDLVAGITALMEKAKAPERKIEEERAAYKKACEEWEKECKRISEQNKKTLKTRLEEEKRKRDEELKKKRDNEIANCEKALAEEKARKEIAEADLANAGFFAFFAKRKLNAEIAEAINNMDSIAKKREKAEKAFESGIRKTKSDKFSQQLEAQIEKQIEKENPYPKKPQPKLPYPSALSPKASATEKKTDNKTRAIYEFMEPGKLYTGSEILEGVPECKGMELRDVYAILRDMGLRGLLEKTSDKRRDYFRISDNWSL